MVIAAAGYLPPVAGAIAQEVIDVLAVANALRMAIQPRTLTDYEEPLSLLRIDDPGRKKAGEPSRNSKL